MAMVRTSIVEEDVGRSEWTSKIERVSATRKRVSATKDLTLG